MRTRKNVKTLTETEKTNFVNTVLALKKKPSILHPGNTGFSRYDDYAEVHRNAQSSAAWAHGGPAFLPWHREFILQFENDLASIDAAVSLPYWDWTDISTQANPLTPDFLGGNGTGADQIVEEGPFASGKWKLNIREDRGDSISLQRDLGADPTAPALPTAGLQNAVLNVAAYDSSPWQGVTNSFRWQCEIALHNLVHRFIGGTMDTTASPNDPLFFLHAANIDRLYAVWQGLHQSSAHYLPVAGGPPGTNLNDALIFNSSGTAPFQTKATPATVMNHHTLGYQYDTETQASLGTLKFAAAHLQVLYGIINDAPGTVPIGPGDPWTQLSPGARDHLLASAVNELAAQIGSANARNQLQTAVAGLTAAPNIKARATSS
ncbi:MAG TPA: tyrosinase family protein [Bryobacteraceae bacterium]|jgi:tyrosinase|nr:tyrosinase family protein [Bryobacteraceae bacterium]